MAMITLTSQNLAFDHNSNENFREVSFSSYLDSKDEAFVRKLAESGRDFVPKDDDDDDEHGYLGSKKYEDGEIGVFGAERYFHEASPRNSNMSPKSINFLQNERTDSRSVQIKLLPGTPSIQSESSSSWNSQSMLLQVALPRSSSRSRSVKGQGKSFLANFGCRCYCSDSGSVEVEESAANLTKPDAKIPVVTPGLENTKISKHCFKDDLFAFPTIDSAPEIHPSLVPFQTEQELGEMGRKSLEVFGSPVPDRRSKSLTISKRLPMLSWDSKETDHSKQKFLYETESDASSDLFEIESLTCKSSPFLVRQASAATASCYAPSEASIEWSVVTASAAEYSIVSEYDEPIRSAVSPRRTLVTPKNTTAKNNSTEVQRRRAGSLLGCKSHKAVHVAEDAYVRNERLNLTPRMRRSSDSYTSSFQGDPRMGINVDYRHRPQVVVTRSSPISNSPRASSLLYIR